MRPLERSQLLDYQTYAEERDDHRSRIMRAKNARRVHVGPHLTFLFENHDTIWYQIQEMMRVEHIVKEADIAHELGTYNELLGGPGELGCTLLIEIESPEERAVWLKKWLPLPHHLYAELEDGTRVPASFDPRQVGEERLSSVQYLKFQTGGRVPVAIGSDFEELKAHTLLTEAQRKALSVDLSQDN